jgi:hypothetical protein
MKIQKIYKASDEYKKKRYNVKHFYEDENNLKYVSVDPEEKQRAIREHNEIKELFALEHLYIAILDDDLPELDYKKNDQVLITDSLPLKKSCCIVISYNENYYFAKYDEVFDNSFTIKPCSMELPAFSQDDIDKEDILGMVVLHERGVEEKIKENIE